MLPSPQHGRSARASWAAARKASRSAPASGRERRAISASGSASSIRVWGMDGEAPVWESVPSNLLFLLRGKPWSADAPTGLLFRPDLDFHATHGYAGCR